MKRCAPEAVWPEGCSVGNLTNEPLVIVDMGRTAITPNQARRLATELVERADACELNHPFWERL